MIFQHTLIENIINGRKTQTRRPVKPGEWFHVDRWQPTTLDQLRQTVYIAPKSGDNDFLSIHTSRIKWQVDRDYAVVPKRGQPVLWWNPETGHYLERKPTTSMVLSSVELNLWRPLRIRLTYLEREDCREISEQDAHAEGFDSAIDFLRLWISIYDKRAFKDIGDPFFVGLALETRPAALYDCWKMRFAAVRS